MTFDWRLLGQPGMVVTPFQARIAADKARAESLRAAVVHANTRSARPPASPEVAPRAAPAGGDDESDRADFANPKMRAAVQREKTRILAILTSPAGVRNPQVALNIATLTALPHSQAIKMIEELESTLPSSASAEPPLARRIIIAGNRRRGEEPMAPSTVKQGQGHRASAAEILAAGRKARNET